MAPTLSLAMAAPSPPASPNMSAAPHHQPTLTRAPISYSPLSIIPSLPLLHVRFQIRNPPVLFESCLVCVDGTRGGGNGGGGQMMFSPRPQAPRPPTRVSPPPRSPMQTP